MANTHFEQNHAVRRALSVAAVAAVLLVLALPVGAADAGRTGTNGGARYGRHHDDDEGPINMGSVAMPQISDFPLDSTYSSIVSIAAAPGRAGKAVITATGQLCTGHKAGVADKVSLRVTVDGASGPGGSQSFSIPTSQASGQVCSSFTLTGTFDQFSAQAHYLSLDGRASSGSAFVSGASLSGILYPYRSRR